MFFLFLKFIFDDFSLHCCCACSTDLTKIYKYFLNNIVESSTRYIINLNIV